MEYECSIFSDFSIFDARRDAWSSRKPECGIGIVVLSDIRNFLPSGEYGRRMVAKNCFSRLKIKQCGHKAPKLRNDKCLWCEELRHPHRCRTGGIARR